MENELLFGKCLNELLMARGWSAARIARELNLDSSYIRKWIRGERVPSLKTDYIDQIAECLSSGLDSTSGKNIRENMIIAIENMGVESAKSNDLSEIIKDLLSEAQVYALKFDTEERILKSTLHEDDVIGLLEKIGKNNKKADKSIAVSSDISTVNTIPAFIKGKQAILYTCIALLKAALECGPEKKGNIIVTFQSESYPFDGYPQLESNFTDILGNLLDDGWRVNHILRLNKNVNRSIRLVKRMINQIGYKRKYHPFYFEQYGITSPANEAVIVEGLGAIICISTEDPEYIDTAFFYSQSDIVESLYKHYSQMNDTLVPLLNIYSENEYFIANTQADIRSGDRLALRGELDSLTIPSSTWEQYLMRALKDNTEVSRHMKRLNARIDSFHEHVARYKYFNIVTVKSINHLLKHKKYLYDNTYKIPSTQDIVVHLENVIYLLKTYENYEVALVNENQDHLVTLPCWQVKGDHSVIIDMVYPIEERESGEEPGLYLEITEGTIAESFREYFFDIWNRITPKYRDKTFVINWLEEQIRWFRQENNLF